MNYFLKNFFTKNHIKKSFVNFQPLIFTVHNITPDSYHNPNHNNTKESFAREFFESLNFNFIITADDGFINDLKFLQKIKNKNLISKKLFITKNFFLKENIPWWRVFDFLFTEKKYKSSLYRNKKLLSKISKHFYENNLPKNFKSLNIIFKNILGESIPYDLNEIISSQMLSESDLSEINSNNIDIGIHTVSHPNLSKLKYKEQFKEIEESYQFNKFKFKNSLNDFAIPFGNPKSYDKNTELIIERLGINCYTNHIKYPLISNKNFKYRINISDYGDGLNNALHFV